MTIYNAPVEDMIFLYEKLRDNKNYNEIERYKEVTTDLVKNILEEAEKKEGQSNQILEFTRVIKNSEK